MSTIAEHNRVHIESGRKQTYGELGVSYFNTLKSNKSQFVMASSYDFEKREENLKTINTHVNSPGEVFGIYGAILGRLLAVGMMDLRLGKLNGEPYYDVIGGVGVRLYKGPVAGRVVFQLGVSNALNHVYMFQSGTAGDYDLVDTYKAVIKSVGVSFNFNMKSPRCFVNPFLNFNVRNYGLFRYQTISLDLLSFSGAAGICKEFGPCIGVLGFQLKRSYDEKKIILHPGIITQCTFVLKGKN
jgi:hypothetical protein